MNTKTSVFVTWVERIIYLLLYDLYTVPWTKNSLKFLMFRCVAPYYIDNTVLYLKLTLSNALFLQE